MNIEKFVEGVRDYIKREFAPFLDRLKALEDRQPEKGDKGDKGEKGEKGDTVIIEFDAQKEFEKYLSSEQGVEFMLSIIAKSGIKGENGKDGADGKDGRDGVDGKDGADGVNGKDGRDGVDGKDGAPGRDALEIDILPSIDFDKSYPRGTYAHHEGGVWRAHTTTDGQRGWDCVISGFSGLSMEAKADDHRHVTLSSKCTGGIDQNLKLFFPVPAFVGVYKDGQNYDQSDCVQFGGCMWIALKGGDLGRPGRNEGEWKLCVKKGADGK